MGMSSEGYKSLMSCENAIRDVEDLLIASLILPSNTRIGNLLKGLRYFSRKQVEYLGDTTFTNNSFLQYTLKATESQVFHDLALIERLAMQRHPELRQTTAKTFTPSLQKADRLSYAALMPAKKLLTMDPVTGKDQQPTVFTYIQKMPAIRVVPYAPVALIGIPYTCLETATVHDFLAIPHEVGHHVFWRGRIRGAESEDAEPLILAVVKQVKEKLGDVRINITYAVAQMPDPVTWLEEIFADVYGCMIAGPVMAVDFQNLQLSRSKSGLIENDGVHPIPLLRPKIYHYTLKKLQATLHLTSEQKSRLSALANRVEDRWNSKLEGLLQAHSSDETAIALAKNTDLQNKMEAIVDAIWNILEPNLDWSNWPWPLATELPKLEEKGIDSILFLDFETRVPVFNKSDPEKPPCVPKEPPDVPQLTESEDFISRFKKDASALRAAEVKFIPEDSGLNDDQVAALWAGGWTEEGPQNIWP